MALRREQPLTAQQGQHWSAANDAANHQDRRRQLASHTKVGMSGHLSFCFRRSDAEDGTAPNQAALIQILVMLGVLLASPVLSPRPGLVKS